MVYLVAALAVVLPYSPLLARVAPVVLRRTGRRLDRWRRWLHHGALARVRGRVRPIERVRSPMEGVDCVFSVTIFGGRDRHGLPRRISVFTGKDFLLENEGGTTLVRTHGADVRFPEGPIVGMPPVRQALPAALQAAIDASPLRDAQALYWRELTFDEDGVDVIGELRVEQAPPDLPFAGTRDRPHLPTLSAVDGVLEILPKLD